MPGRGGLSSSRWNETYETRRCSRTSRPSTDRCSSRGSAQALPGRRSGALARRHRDRLPRRSGSIDSRATRSAASASSRPTAAGLRPITEGPNDDSEPRWSPDGRRLSFRSDRASKGQHQIFVLETGVPAEARQLTTLPGTVEWHRWSADGSRMLAGVAGSSAEQADALGSGTLGGEQDVPPWVPEVESVDDAEGERRSLWVVDVGTGEARRVSGERSQRLGGRLVRCRSRRRGHVRRAPARTPGTARALPSSTSPPATSDRSRRAPCNSDGSPARPPATERP